MQAILQKSSGSTKGPFREIEDHLKYISGKKDRIRNETATIEQLLRVEKDNLAKLRQEGRSDKEIESSQAICYILQEKHKDKVAEFEKWLPDQMSTMTALLQKMNRSELGAMRKLSHALSRGLKNSTDVTLYAQTVEAMQDEYPDSADVLRTANPFFVTLDLANLPPDVLTKDQLYEKAAKECEAKLGVPSIPYVFRQGTTIACKHAGTLRSNLQVKEAKSTPFWRTPRQFSLADAVQYRRKAVKQFRALLASKVKLTVSLFGDVTNTLFSHSSSTGMTEEEAKGVLEAITTVESTVNAVLPLLKSCGTEDMSSGSAPETISMCTFDPSRFLLQLKIKKGDVEHRAAMGVLDILDVLNKALAGIQERIASFSTRVLQKGRTVIRTIRLALKVAWIARRKILACALSAALLFIFTKGVSGIVSVLGASATLLKGVGDFASLIRPMCGFFRTYGNTALMTYLIVSSVMSQRPMAHGLGAIGMYLGGIQLTQSLAGSTLAGAQIAASSASVLGSFLPFLATASSAAAVGIGYAQGANSALSTVTNVTKMAIDLGSDVMAQLETKRQSAVAGLLRLFSLKSFTEVSEELSALTHRFVAFKVLMVAWSWLHAIFNSWAVRDVACGIAMAGGEAAKVVTGAASGGVNTVTDYMTGSSPTVSVEDTAELLENELPTETGDGVISGMFKDAKTKLIAALRNYATWMDSYVENSQRRPTFFPRHIKSKAKLKQVSWFVDKLSKDFLVYQALGPSVLTAPSQLSSLARPSTYDPREAPLTSAEKEAQRLQQGFDYRKFFQYWNGTTASKGVYESGGTKEDYNISALAELYRHGLFKEGDSFTTALIRGLVWVIMPVDPSFVPVLYHALVLAIISVLLKFISNKTRARAMEARTEEGWAALDQTEIEQRQRASVVREVADSITSDDFNASTSPPHVNIARLEELVNKLDRVVSTEGTRSGRAAPKRRPPSCLKPPKNAQDYKVGTRRKGADGFMYKVVQHKNRRVWNKMVT